MAAGQKPGSAISDGSGPAVGRKPAPLPALNPAVFPDNLAESGRPSEPGAVAPVLLSRLAGKGGTTVNTQEAGLSRRSLLTAAEALPRLPWSAHYVKLDPIEVGRAAYCRPSRAG